MAFSAYFHYGPLGLALFQRGVGASLVGFGAGLALDRK